MDLNSKVSFHQDNKLVVQKELDNYYRKIIQD